MVGAGADARLERRVGFFAGFLFESDQEGMDEVMGLIPDHLNFKRTFTMGP